MPARPPLIGKYAPPAVRVGDRVTCLFRDALCVVTSVSDAPIPWPRVRALEHRGGSGLWACGELLRAIRTESAVALKVWFGASTTTVWAWRKAFGVGGRATTRGSRKAIRAAAIRGAAAVRAKEWTDAELDKKAATSKHLGLRPPDRWKGRGGWIDAQVRLLARMTDEQVARRTGRSVNAVRNKRRRASRMTR
jgi:hypothetical protein